MKRRSLLILIAILLLVVFTLASCGNKKDDNTPPHQHSFDLTSYQSDENYHWRGATCEHVEQRLQVTAHSDENNDGACDVCERVTCTHSYDEEHWTSDENGHWHASTCGHETTKDNAAHGDENSDGICDTCDYVTCTHPTEVEWSNSVDGHWQEYTCDCEIEPVVSEHRDNDKDGLCDTCDYVTCAHNPEDKWSYDAYTHWHATDCGCEVRIDEANHSYADDGFTCTVCFKACEHPAKEEWSYNETSHWHDSSCGHEGYIHDEGEHADPNLDGICDVCGYENSTHVHTFELAFNNAQHYYLSTCEHLIAESFENHTDEGGDGYCDVCGIYLDSIADIVDSATSEDAAARVNGGTWTEEMNDHITEHTYSYYTDHLVYGTDSATYYLSTYLKDGVPTLLKVLVSNGSSTVIPDADISELQGEYLSIMYGSITGYGLENFIYALYTFASEGSNLVYDFTEDYDPNTGIVAFSFVYEEVITSGSSAQLFSVAFSMEGGSIKTAAIQARSYYQGNYVLDTENNVCIVAPTAVADANYAYVFNQTIGARSEAKNPYNAEELFITDLKIFNQATGEEIKDGDIVEIFAGPDNALYITLPEEDIDKAASSGIELIKESWDIVANTYSHPYKIYSYNKTGDYTITVSSSSGGSITFTLRINKIAPTSLSPAVVDEDGNKSEATSVETYAGVPAIIGAIAGNEAGSSKVTATVTAVDGSVVTLVEDGESWLVSASVSGTYTITLTSVLDESISTTITVVVIDPPAIDTLLKGNYVTETEDGTTVTVKLYPAYDGALNGTVKIIYDNNAFQNRLVINETATYAYADGVITLTHTEGDGLGNIKALKITDRYEIALVVLPYGSAMDTEIEYVLEKGPDDPNGTEKAPFVITGSTEETVSVPAGGYIYYIFTPSARGTLTVSVLGGFTDFDILYSTGGFTDTMNTMFASTEAIELTADDTLYIKVGTMSGEASSFGVSFSFEEAAIIAPTYENLAGTWEGTETNSGIFANQTFTLTLQLNADGTGTGTHSITDIGTFNVTAITIDGMNVTVTTDAKSNNNVLYFVYDDGKLVNVDGKMGMMFGKTMLLTQSETASDSDEDGVGGEIIETVFSNSVTAPTEITQSGVYSVTVAEGEKGYFSIAHTLLGSEAVSVSISVDGGVLYEAHPLRGDTALPVSSTTQNVDSIVNVLILAVSGDDGAAAVITLTITLAEGTPAE